MCGRYYVDDEIAVEIDKVIWTVSNKTQSSSVPALQAKDIHPADSAPVIVVTDKGMDCQMQKWGFPGFDRRQIVFNARSESAMEKRMFRDSVEHRRIVVPATWFYEWNGNKEKNIFIRQDKQVIFMAGFYSRYEDGDRFVILTTQANASMKPVHDRMPLILEESEIVPWLSDKEKSKDILRKVPCMLERRTEFEQMSLF